MPGITEAAVGIDFGTSNCSVGIWADDSPVLLPLDGTSFRLPSVLFFAREPAVARISEDELQKRVRTALAEQARARTGVASELRHAEERLQRASSALHEYESRPVHRIRRQHQRQISRQRSLVEARESECSLLRRRISQLSKSAGEIQAEHRDILRREASQASLEASAKLGLHQGMRNVTEILFGSDAINQYLDGAVGDFVVSPKGFLGAELSPRYQGNFKEVVSRTLAYLRDAVGTRLSADGLSVIGRPVHFPGTESSNGDARAERTLLDAANAAGFPNVEFLFEPIAAALDYERTLQEDKTALVLDVGGGTTDCSMIVVGPSYRARDDRTSSVLGSKGVRVGGKDLDFTLASAAVSPLLGYGTHLSDGRPFPRHYFQDALSMSIPERTKFHSQQTTAELDELARLARRKKEVRRLLRVQRERLGDYILWQTEQTKVKLSRSKRSSLRLDRVERQLDVSVGREDYAKFAARIHGRLVGVVEEVLKQAGTRPDVVYLTGGMAQSPSLRGALQDHLGGSELVEGDYFGNVVSGLTTWAHRRLQAVRR